MARPAKYNWDSIRLDLKAGMPHEYVHKKYEVPYDAINKHLIRNPLVVSQEAKSLIDGFDGISQQVGQLKDKSPELAQRTLDIVKEKHPEFKKAMVNLSAKMFKRIGTLTDEASAGDINSLAKGMQTITDTLGISQRHAKQADVNVQNNISIIDPFAK